MQIEEKDKHIEGLEEKMGVIALMFEQIQAVDEEWGLVRGRSDSRGSRLRG